MLLARPMKTHDKTKLIRISAIVALAAILAIGCGPRKNSRILLSEKIPEIDSKREAKILTAFFGLDNGLTQAARVLYRKAPGMDGMPIVFSHEIDPSTLDANDFEIKTQNGTFFAAEAVTLLPANEEFELKTVLLIGEYGNYPENPPISVEIVGDLITRTGDNLKGNNKAVIPLPEGPILSDAEYFTFTGDYPYVKKGRGCDCPREETKTIIKTIWSGGVRAASGEELGVNELEDFIVTLVYGADTIQVTPFLLADLSDNDNNIDLCLRESGVPIFVQVNANTAIDPRDDKNPRTEMAVRSRW